MNENEIFYEDSAEAVNSGDRRGIDRQQLKTNKLSF